MVLVVFILNSPLRASSVHGSDGEIVAVRVGLSIVGPRRLYIELVGQNSFGDGKVAERIPVHDLHSLHWEKSERDVGMCRFVSRIARAKIRGWIDGNEDDKAITR